MSESEIIDYARKLKRFVRSEEKWRTRETLNLIASENFASPEARSFLSSDLSNRYSARDEFYRGTKFQDQVEALAVDLAKKIFNAKFADVRPLSGHTCSLAVFLSFLKPRDKVIMCPPDYGGYPGASHLGLGALLELESLYYPFNPEKMNIISDDARKVVSSKRPQMAIFGASYLLFPHDIRGCLPRDYSGVAVYDGSHVMGLIAGGEFQQPLKEGCKLLIGSTHKTLFGPQGGIILSNNSEIFRRVDSTIYPGVVDNIHWNRVACLAFAEIELLKFGRRYASQVIRNARHLGRSLIEEGVKVKCASLGITSSHQVILDYDSEKSITLADRLEALDIITDNVIRLGTSEVTRRGMNEADMETIASLVADAVLERKSKDTIKGQVHRLVRSFPGVKYSLS